MKESTLSCVRDGRRFGLIWFGAAISLAEIEAGLWSRGSLSAVILGHVLGGLMLFVAGMIGARTQKNGMECTRAFFGKGGMTFFALANFLQLIGWTAVMLSQGADAAKALLPGVPLWVLTAILGALVVAWLFVGLRSFSLISTCTMTLLLLMVAVLTFRVFHGATPVPLEEAPSFWNVFELSLAMPLSWLPLISDYTREAKCPRTACATSAIVYTLGSIWMYAVGIGLARLGQDNIAAGILHVNMGLWALFIVLVSTTTTTFLDAYSAGESIKALFAKVPPKAVGALVCLIGVVLSLAGIMANYTDFLYLISSLFAPMATVMIVAWLLKKTWIPGNILAFAAGFLAYQLCQRFPTQCHSLPPSLTAIALAAILALALNTLRGKRD